MTDVARLMLEGIDEDAVEFRPNYDGKTKEPIVLPGAFPNLLANGSQGIAVGMATSIPPHNVAELCDAALQLIKKPDTKTQQLLKFVKGPDFPTGGIIVDSHDSIAEAYSTGRGSFRVRAKWQQEEGSRGWVVVVTQIPWRVKSRLIENRRAPQRRKLLCWLTCATSRPRTCASSSSRSRARDPALLMESPFRLTELESRIPLNMNVLIKGKVPKVSLLDEVLREWLHHRRDVLRATRHRQGQIEPGRLLAGHLIAYLIMRYRSSAEDEPKPVLMRTFKINDVQADATSMGCGPCWL